MVLPLTKPIVRNRPRVGQDPPLFDLRPDGLTFTPNGPVQVVVQPEEAPPFCYDVVGATATPALPDENFEVNFRVPGSFCPSQLLINPPADVWLDSISVGLEEHIIAGRVSALLFSTLNNCGLISCLRCICLPGVSMRIRGTADQPTVNFTMLGCFREACDPEKPMIQLIPPNCPSYPEKLVGFATDVPAGGVAEVAINTPGRFCPRRVLFTSGTGAFITAIINGTENQIVTGETAVDYFMYTAANCPPLATDCICMPGVDLIMRFRNPTVAPIVVTGAMIGAYEEACS